MGFQMGFHNDTGTISAIPYAVLTLVIFGLFLIAIGPVIDEIILVDNSMMGQMTGQNVPAFPYSAQRGETLSFLLMCWGALGFCAVFCVALFLLMNGSQRGSGGI